MKHCIYLTVISILIITLYGCASSQQGKMKLSDIIYGPNPDRIIDESKVTYYVSPTGDDGNDGCSRKNAFHSIQKAVDVVKAGETILVTKGVYREGFHIAKSGTPDAWINIVAEPGAEIKGSKREKNWRKEAGFKYQVYSVPLPKLYAYLQKEGMVGVKWLENRSSAFLHHTEQVFVNGKILNHIPVKAMLKPRNVFWVDYNNKRIYVCLKDEKNPNIEKTEVTDKTWAIAIGGAANQNVWGSMEMDLKRRANYIRIDGFKIRHIGGFCRMAGIQIRGTCTNIIVENCDVRFVNWSGIGVGRAIFIHEKKRIISQPENVIVRNNITSDCGVMGISVGGGDKLIFEKNIIDRNNYKRLSYVNEGGGIKALLCSKTIIRHNIVRNNYNEGLWFDYGNEDCVIENNLVCNNYNMGIMIECTPQIRIFTDKEGKVLPRAKFPSAESIKKLKQTGVVVRNNIVTGTTSHGKGIYYLNSGDGKVYNNIVAFNAGVGLDMTGSPVRKGNNGCVRNIFSSNISYKDHVGIHQFSLKIDPLGRWFGNQFKNNLVINDKETVAFRVDNRPVTREAFNKVNNGAENYYSKKKIFRDPEYLDFTFTDMELADKIGFNAKAMRLDWKEYYQKSSERKMSGEKKLICNPIDLTEVLNRPLIDKIPEDGKGGWTDQGDNDLAQLPSGKQTFCGITYNIGDKNNGALAFKNNCFRGAETLPDKVDIKIGAKYNNLFFLYTGAHLSNKGAEVARISVNYADGTKVVKPIITGKHILDWWTDIEANWRLNEKLNDNGAYLAWKGANGVKSQVSVFYLKWTNPEPLKEIKSITVSNEKSNPNDAFFLLAISGSNPPMRKNKSDLVFYQSCDGDLDAIDAYGDDILAKCRTPEQAMKIIPGVKDKSFVPVKNVTYPITPDMPIKAEGTISIWLKINDWKTAKRAKYIKGASYRRTMVPFMFHLKRLHDDRWKGHHFNWGLRFHIKGDELNELTMDAIFGSRYHDPAIARNVTKMISLGKWFNVTLVWEKGEKASTVERQVYLDGKLMAQDIGYITDYKKLKKNALYLGNADNGGHRWFGAIDEFKMWDRALTPKEIAELCNK